MSANLDRPVLVTPTGAPGGYVIVGTGSDREAHTLISGRDQMDVVTIEVWNNTAGNKVATVKWPNTDGGSSDVSMSVLASAVDGVVPLIDRWTGNGGGVVYVNGAAGLFFKVNVERYQAGKSGTQET